MKKYDVVIIGGGTSGCACAYMCAKNNLSTLLVEKNNFLGGLMTGGLVVPIMKSSVDDTNCEYYNNLISKAKSYNAQITYGDNNDGWLNPELLKIVIEDLLTENGFSSNLDILYETTVHKVIKNKNLISHIALKSKLLSLPIEAKYYVDATGSAEFSFLAGCNFLRDTKKYQQNSLRFILGNIDSEKFVLFLKSLNDSEDITNTYRIDRSYHFTTASTWDENKKWALDKVLKEGVAKKLLIDSDRAYFQLFSVAGGHSQVAFNCPRIDNYRDNPFAASNELIKARKAIYRILNFTKAKFPGFENAIITNIATQSGIREEKRVETKHVFTKSELINGDTYPNPVLRANYGIDIHSKEKNSSSLVELSSYELPLTSLMSANYDNLFVIGKILGAEFEAQSALRVQKSCMSMGEAVANYIANI